MQGPEAPTLKKQRESRTSKSNKVKEFFETVVGAVVALALLLAIPIFVGLIALAIASPLILITLLIIWSLS